MPREPKTTPPEAVDELAKQVREASRSWKKARAKELHRITTNDFRHYWPENSQQVLEELAKVRKQG